MRYQHPSLGDHKLKAVRHLDESKYDNYKSQKNHRLDILRVFNLYSQWEKTTLKNLSYS